MSNAMSRSKSRWKGALLATVATAAIAPLAAHATMTVGLTFQPMGTASSPSTPLSNAYIDPIDPVQIYVYATVTGTSAPSASYVDGLQYLYYNVNAAITSGTVGLGTITAANLNTNFGGTAFNNGSGGIVNGSGAQSGNLSSSALTSTPSIVVGDPLNQAAMAKPRNANPQYVSSGASTSAINVSGNSVSFLLETLTFTPNTAAIVNGNFSTPSSLNSVSFNVSVPSLSSSYTGSNYFQGLTGTPGAGQPAGTSNTSSNYSSAVTSVKLSTSLPGDVNLDGTVGFSDLGIVLGHYGASDTKWTDGNVLYATNTSNPAFATIGFGDLGTVLGEYGSSVGPAPSLMAADAALLADPSAVALLEANGITPVAAVPEPASLGLVGMLAVGLVGRRRRR